jgi:3-oxo-5-alpha-steroid 4-dehydrogenase 1
LGRLFYVSKTRPLFFFLRNDNPSKLQLDTTATPFSPFSKECVEMVRLVGVDFDLNSFAAAWCVCGVCVAFVLPWCHRRFASAWGAREHVPHVVRFIPQLPGAAAWFLMEGVSAAAFIAAFLASGGGGRGRFSVPALLFVGHYCYRAGLYPLLRVRSLRPVPLEFALSATFFNVVNGSLNGASVAMRPPPSVPVVALGAAVWLAGLAGNVHSDEVTRRLRKPGEGRVYRVPPAVGMHRFLISPNYFCEMVEWLGYWVAAGFSPAALSFVLWTAANLIPHSVLNARWARAKFGSDLPPTRRTFIPFLW